MNKIFEKFVAAILLESNLGYLGMLNQTIILVADDNSDDVVLMKRALRRACLFNPVHVVNDGSETIEYLTGAIEAKSFGHTISLLICLDLNMPGKDGFDVLRWIRAQPGLDEIPVVIVSNSGERSDKDRAIHLGASDYLTKPETYEGLVNVVETLRRFLSPAEVTEFRPATYGQRCQPSAVHP